MQRGTLVGMHVRQKKIFLDFLKKINFFAKREE